MTQKIMEEHDHYKNTPMERDYIYYESSDTVNIQEQKEVECRYMGKKNMNVASGAFAVYFFSLYFEV